VSFQARADDTIQVWLNSQLNTLLPPSPGNLNGPAVPGGTTNQGWFRVGVNCIYVLVEDLYFGAMGFDLAGTISANGLLATPAKGIPGTFEPCNCPNGPAPINPQSSARGVSHDDDQEVVNEIIKIAETRRTAKQKSQDQEKEPPKK
jgi:hypothetical protein